MSCFRLPAIDSNERGLMRAGLMGFDPNTKCIYFSDGMKWIKILTEEPIVTMREEQKLSLDKTDWADPSPNEVGDAIDRISKVVAPLVGGKI